MCIGTTIIFDHRISKTIQSCWWNPYWGCLKTSENALKGHIFVATLIVFEQNSTTVVTQYSHPFPTSLTDLTWPASFGHATVPTGTIPKGTSDGHHPDSIEVSLVSFSWPSGGDIEWWGGGHGAMWCLSKWWYNPVTIYKWDSWKVVNPLTKLLNGEKKRIRDLFCKNCNFRVGSNQERGFNNWRGDGYSMSGNIISWYLWRKLWYKVHIFHIFHIIHIFHIFHIFPMIFTSHFRYFMHVSLYKVGCIPAISFASSGLGYSDGQPLDPTLLHGL